MSKLKLYLDDVRTPIDTSWLVARNYEEFIKIITDNGGLKNFDIISLDHDLGDTAMAEYYNNVKPNYIIDYNNITEKTGLDCAKWLIDQSIDGRKTIPHPFIDGLTIDDENQEFIFPTVYVHSANPIGSGNIMGYINNFFMNFHQPQTCVRVRIEHSIHPDFLMTPEERDKKWKKNNYGIKIRG